MNYLRFIKIPAFILLIFSLAFSNGLLAQKRVRYTVVLDAGHGGKDPGKVGYKRYKEKDIALSIVLRVGKILKKRGFKVVYTRTKDVFVPLKKRGYIANKADADLFVSVHCNAHHTQAIGTETWVLSTSANRKNFEVAKAENEVIFLERDYQENYKNFDPSSPTSTIGLTLEQEENLDQSILLAAFVQEQFKTKLKRIDRGVKQNIFVVLHQTYMPSILIEAGFITNKKEAIFLNSSKGKAKIAGAISNAISRYFKRMQANYIPPPTIKPTKKNPAPKNKNKTKSTIYYKIQIASSFRKIAPKSYNFKKLNPVERVKVGKHYKYYFGKVTQYKKAKTLLKKAKAKGYRTAFIAAFRNGNKISVIQARKEQKEK